MLAPRLDHGVVTENPGGALAVIDIIIVVKLILQAAAALALCQAGVQVKPRGWPGRLGIVVKGHGAVLAPLHAGGEPCYITVAVGNAHLGLLLLGGLLLGFLGGPGGSISLRLCLLRLAGHLLRAFPRRPRRRLQGLGLGGRRSHHGIVIVDSTACNADYDIGHKCSHQYFRIARDVPLLSCLVP